MLRRKTPSSARLPLRLELMERRLVPAIFSVSNLNDSGAGSIRQAVIDANNNSGQDTILVENTIGTVTLTSGDIQITAALTIFGPGSSKLTISGNKQSRIFTISNEGSFHVGIEGMTLTNGDLTTNSNTADGGAICADGQEVELRDVVMTNNIAMRGGAVFMGNGARLTMLNCSATGNTAQSEGGAVYTDYNNVTYMKGCTISGNTAQGGNGGGIYVDGRGELRLDNSTVSGNSSSNNGGGIFLYGQGSLTTVASTIAGNTCPNRGGGVMAEVAGVDLTNSTISGNSARIGGGLDLGGNSQGPGQVVNNENGEGYYNAGPATIKHCTISGNSAVAPTGQPGGVSNTEGGGIFATRDVTLINTIVAINSADAGKDLQGGVLDLTSLNTFTCSFCLIQDKGNASIDDQGGNIFGVAPLLGPLQNNGGPTQTQALLIGSRGIDEGDPEFVPPPSTDQRGFPRVANNRLDIGAYELQPGVTPPITPPPVELIAVGSGLHGDSLVRVYDKTGKLLVTFQPYDTSFRGEIHVATGDINGDGVEDVVTGAGAGGGPHVQAFDGKMMLSGKPERIVSALGSYFAYNPAFGGGVNVACGDVNGDGKADIITGAGPGGGPHVIAWDSATGQAITSFYAYDKNFHGGVSVGAGDFLGQGTAQIITGAGPGGGPHVRVFDHGAVIKEFFAYNAKFLGGVYVAGGDITGDGKADIITGAGASGGPHVKVFDGASLTCVRSFFAFESIFTGGVRVATANLDADVNAEIIVGAGPLGGPHVRFVDNDEHNTQLNSFYCIDKDFNGGVFVG